MCRIAHNNAHGLKAVFVKQIASPKCTTLEEFLCAVSFFSMDSAIFESKIIFWLDIRFNHMTWVFFLQSTSANFGFGCEWRISATEVPVYVSDWICSVYQSYMVKNRNTYGTLPSKLVINTFVRVTKRNKLALSQMMCVA